MTLHLIKLSVGSETITDLADWQQQLLKEKRKHGEPAELMHITRQTPKRAEELLAGGSIYWVIKGWLCARQRLRELRPITYNDMPHCGIIYEPELIRTVPRAHRPFQDWRYLNASDAPADLGTRTLTSEAPDELIRELADLGLI